MEVTHPPKISMIVDGLRSFSWLAGSLLACEPRNFRNALIEHRAPGAAEIANRLHTST